MKTRSFPLTRAPRARLHRLNAALVLPVMLLLLMAASLTGCTLHSGSQTLAYLKHGALWASDADGSNAHLLATGPILDFAWSPDHKELVYRTATEHPVNGAPGARATAELPSTLFVLGVNGGTPVQISSLTAYTRSPAWWDAQGNHLLYAERVNGQPQFVVAQPDQPAAIASKLVPGATVAPAPNADASQFAYIDAAGQVHIAPIGQAGSAASIVTHGALLQLPGTDRPAHILWQPHARAIVYPAAASNGVSLLRYDAASKTTTRLLTLPTLLDADFSPDGKLLLTRTPNALKIWQVAQPGAPLLTLADTQQSGQAWWSPDSSQLLIEDANALRLVQARAGAAPHRIATANASDEPAPTAGWLPSTADPWNPAGGQFVYTQGGRAYAVKVQQDGTAGTPREVASHVHAVAWGTADPSSVFLQPVALGG